MCPLPQDRHLRDTIARGAPGMNSLMTVAQTGDHHVTQAGMTRRVVQTADIEAKEMVENPKTVLVVDMAAAVV